MGLYYYNKFLGENDPRLDFNQWVSLPWLCLSFMQSLCILVRTQKTDVFLLSARNLPELATFGGSVFCIDDESQVVRVHTNWFQVQFPGPLLNLNIMVSPFRYCLSDRGRGQ